MAGIFLSWGPDETQARMTTLTSSHLQVHFPWLRMNAGSCNGWYWTTISASDPRPPFPFPGGQRWLFVDGEVFEDDCRISDEDSASEAHASMANLIARYEARGIESLVGLNGIYNIVVLDTARAALEVTNDVLGILPVYYWLKGDGGYLGSEMFPLTKRGDFRATLDLAALSDLLMLGYVLRPRTLAAQIHQLGAGSVLRIQAGRSHEARVAELRASPRRGVERELRSLASEMDDCLLQAVRRRLPEHQAIVLPLSGGLDSRTLAGAICRLDRRPNAVSFGHSYQLDPLIARQIARCLDFPIQRAELPHEFPWCYQDEHFAVSEGQVGLATAWCQMLRVVASSPPLGAIFTGYLGDAATGGHLNFARDGSGAAEAFELAFAHSNRREGGFTEPELEAILHPHVYENVRGVTRSTAFEMYEAGGDRTYERLYHWDMYARQRSVIASHVWAFRNFGMPRAPFYDRSFLELTASLPFSALDGQRLYRERLRMFDPQLAAMITEGDRQPVAANLWGSLQGRAYSVVLASVGRLRPNLTHSWWGSAHLGPPEVAERLLREREEMLSPYFRVEALREFRDLDAYVRLGHLQRLVTFVQWCEAFLA